MFEYVEVYKNQYPFRTVHVETCAYAKRAKPYNVTHLDTERIERYDTIRTDFCARCMPRDYENRQSAYVTFITIEAKAAAIRRREQQRNNIERKIEMLLAQVADLRQELLEIEA